MTSPITTHEETYLRALLAKQQADMPMWMFPVWLSKVLAALDAERAEVARLQSLLDRWQAATGETLLEAEALRTMHDEAFAEWRKANAMILRRSP